MLNKAYSIYFIRIMYPMLSTDVCVYLCVCVFLSWWVLLFWSQKRRLMITSQSQLQKSWMTMSSQLQHHQIGCHWSRQRRSDRSVISKYNRHCSLKMLIWNYCSSQCKSSVGYKTVEQRHSMRLFIEKTCPTK